MHSDPNNSDSDNDGYADKEDPNPLKNDVQIWALDDKQQNSTKTDLFKYAEITPPSGFISGKGGNQSWFRDLKNTSTLPERLIEDGGCGVISAGDVIVWEQYKNKTLSFSDYSSIVRDIANNYINPFDWTFIPSDSIVSTITDGKDTWGVTPFNYKNGLKSYFKNNLNINLKINYIYVQNPDFDNVWAQSYGTAKATEKNKTEILNSIKNMLNNNIPVPMMIGYDIGNMGVDFYENRTPPKLTTVSYPSVDAHWVNIIGLIKDDVDNKTKLIISSWGELYIIDFEQFFNFHGFSGGIVNIEYK